MLYSPEPPIMARVGFVFMGYLIYERVLLIVPEKEMEPQMLSG
jgi:hypothetical protein